MPDAPKTTPPQNLEPEIHVIPDAYYGTAVKVRVEEKAAQKPTTEKPAGTHRLALPILVGVVLLLIVAGGFLYMNWDLVFPPAPKPQVVIQTPEPIPAPSAPIDVSATSTNPQSVSVRWTDTSSNESGFRIERRAGDTGEFAAVTNLPPNSSSFLDVSVNAGTVYTYRIIALNATGESAPSPEATATVPQTPPPVPVPVQPKLPPAGLDTDSDGITDLEEQLYGTDPRSPDTDADGFLDGNEVFNLYNPNGKAPASLLDSKIVRSVETPIGWVMSVPSAWSIKLDSADGSAATIDSHHGERFVVSVEPNPEKKPVLDWYLAKHPDAKLTQVLQYRSKRGYEGIIGADLLTTYIPWGDRIFILTYDVDDQPFINFRTTYYMVLNSLMLSGVPQTPLATNVPLPFEPSATTSGVITQPVPVVEATGTASSTP